MQTHGPNFGKEEKKGKGVWFACFRCTSLKYSFEKIHPGVLPFEAFGDPDRFPGGASIVVARVAPRTRVQQYLHDIGTLGKRGDVQCSAPSDRRDTWGGRGGGVTCQP